MTKYFAVKKQIGGAMTPYINIGRVWPPTSPSVREEQKANLESGDTITIKWHFHILLPNDVMGFKSFLWGTVELTGLHLYKGDSYPSESVIIKLYGDCIFTFMICLLCLPH